MNNEIPKDKLQFSFIANNPHAYAMDIKKHGSAWVTKHQYEQIMKILYG